MSYVREYAGTEPDRAAVDAMDGTVVLEFGTPWCGHCNAAQPALQRALEGRDGVRHIKVEDGRGRPLGRSFKVKLWPTLVVLRGGEELVRLVRPADDEIQRTLGSL